MQAIKRNLAEKLSYLIKPEGEVHAVMPDEETFSLKALQQYVGGNIEVVCRTRDGYILLSNKEGKQKGLPVNEVATSLCSEESGSGEIVAGKAMLAHPDHIDKLYLAKG